MGLTEDIGLMEVDVETFFNRIGQALINLIR